MCLLPSAVAFTGPGLAAGDLTFDGAVDMFKSVTVQSGVQQHFCFVNVPATSSATAHPFPSATGPWTTADSNVWVNYGFWCSPSNVASAQPSVVVPPFAFLPFPMNPYTLVTPTTAAVILSTSGTYGFSTVNHPTTLPVGTYKVSHCHSHWTHITLTLTQYCHPLLRSLLLPPQCIYPLKRTRSSFNTLCQFSE